MSEPTSRSGEPDQFAAVRGALKCAHGSYGHQQEFEDCTYAQCTSIRAEIKAAQERMAWQDTENNRVEGLCGKLQDEVAAMRDRERVYRELVEASRELETISYSGHHDWMSWVLRWKDALAECAKR